MTEKAYVGQELEIFANAIRWKEYFSSVVRPFVGQRVVEVGAGLGGTTAFLLSGKEESCICLEPDPVLVAGIEDLKRAGKLPPHCRVVQGLISDLPPQEVVDTFFYIDVLEHIENDGAETAQAASRLCPGGHLIVVGPALNALYSPFDKSIGHHRRYDKGMMRALTPPSCELVKLCYLDSLGLMISLANRLMLRQSLPTHDQIAFWDRRVVPISRVLDPLLFHAFGRSIVAVWKRAA